MSIPLSRHITFSIHFRRPQAIPPTTFNWNKITFKIRWFLLASMLIFNCHCQDPPSRRYFLREKRQISKFLSLRCLDCIKGKYFDLTTKPWKKARTKLHQNSPSVCLVLLYFVWLLLNYLSSNSISKWKQMNK